jgi:4-hydroxybenzoate polyprenyltransferase
VAIGTSKYQFVGAVVLHVSFLAYLESRHSHSYRARVPSWVAYSLAIIGTFLYGKIEALPYLFFSFLYTKKNKKLGLVSPVFRGLQSLFLVAGIAGYANFITYLAAGLLFLRNLFGDFRDVEKDKAEGMRTLPILAGVNKNIKYIHLAATIGTSIVWWIISPLSVIWLFVVIIIEVSTYNLTPR